MGRLLALEGNLHSAGVSLDNIADILADMRVYPLESEVVAEDMKKLQVGTQPIRTRYLGHVTGYQPIRDRYFPD